VQIDDGDVGLRREHELAAALGGAGDAGHVPAEAGQHVTQEDAERSVVLHDRHAAHGGGHRGIHTRNIGSRDVFRDCRS
jgi:hypothetical protein